MQMETGFHFSESCSNVAARGAKELIEEEASPLQTFYGSISLA